MRTETEKQGMRIIGITGGIGTGKSTASRYLRELGYDVIDADDIARELASDSRVINEIRDYFGDEMIKDDGTLDRKRMADVVFSDLHRREMLESIITSRVIEEVAARISDFRSGQKNAMRGDTVFLDAPTLFETGADRLVDEVWLVTCDLEKRLDRTAVRDSAQRDELEARIAAQMSEDEKAERADLVFYNNGTREELRSAIDDALK